MRCAEAVAADGAFEVLGLLRFGDTFHVPLCDVQALCRVVVQALVHYCPCIALTGYVLLPTYREVVQG